MAQHTENFHPVGVSVSRNGSRNLVNFLPAHRCVADQHIDRIVATINGNLTRVGELLKARWVDIDETEKTWTIPAENSKNGRAHLIHLSAFALKQLAVMKKDKSGPYLLPGRVKDSGMSDKAISKAVRDRIRKEPLKRRTPKTGTLVLSGGEWSPHDLRRTMASRMGDLKIEPHVIERCLNHVQQGIVGVYQRQEYLQERKEAFEKWGKKLASIQASNSPAAAKKSKATHHGK